MSGLLALLDDVAALAKLAAASLDDIGAQAAKAGSKAAGVVIDDAAVTPRYVTGLSANREVSIIARIALGSLKNKLIILLPAALALSVFLPGAITPLLMLGGLFLCYEGFEKVMHLFGHQEKAATTTVQAKDERALEDEKVAGAIRTDFILSAEIMAIALATIESPDLFTRAVVLAAVGLLITAVVYGVVMVIVKADDFGLWLAKRGGILAPVGRLLVSGMPPFLSLLSLVGTAAMLWVGGDILVHGLAHFGVTGPEHIIHAAKEAAQAAVPEFGAVLAWVSGAAIAAVKGLIAGGVVALLLVPVKAMRA